MVCVILVTLPAWLTGGAWSLFGDDPGSTHLGIGYRRAVLNLTRCLMLFSPWFN